MPLNVDFNGKEVTSYSQCRKKNSMVNTCDKVNYSESLFDRSGGKNWGHYYWVADWVNTTSGPIAIYRTATELLVVDIKNKEVHQIFTRTMGVNDHEVSQGLDGKVSLGVTLGFSKEQVNDVEDYIIQRKSEKIDILDELEI